MKDKVTVVTVRIRYGTVEPGRMGYTVRYGNPIKGFRTYPYPSRVLKTGFLDLPDNYRAPLEQS